MSFLKRFQTSLESLYLLPKENSYVIAYSGGADSHVLLHCCHALNLPVRAVHIHHGLQAVADEWVNHCQSVCEQLNVHIDVVYVDAQQKKGQSPEESARIVRYQALREYLAEGDCLLTGQHLNDQAETLLIQLFRTATTAGLASMPELKQLDGYVHARPLLTFSRSEIEHYATLNALQWIEDPSNQDITFDRNFIRKSVLPLMESRWPEVVTQLSIVADLQSKNLSVLEDMAAIDLANNVVDCDKRHTSELYSVVSMLAIESLNKLSLARLLNVLRYWLMAAVNEQATRNLLEEIVYSLIQSKQDANPVIEFSGFEFRKFNDCLYLLKKNGAIDVSSRYEWTPSLTKNIALANNVLSTKATIGCGLRQELNNERLTISYRQGGEKFHPGHRQHSQTLKKLMQEEGIPPWERASYPLVYCSGEIIAVIGLWYAKQFTAEDDEEGWEIIVSKVF